jgi:putative nucleotidyltransferase-like protein
LELLPPAISDPELFALLVDILSVSADTDANARLRLRLIGKAASWQALVDLAEAQGVLPPLVWALRRRTLLLPVPGRITSAAAGQHPTVQLEASYQRHMERRQRQRDQLADIIATLNRAGIEPLLLKGSRYLMAPARTWREARDMRDLDLLVRPDDAKRAFDALVAEGYGADPDFGPTDQHLPELWKSDCPSAVELHVDALAFSARATLSTPDLWRHGRRSSNEHGAFVVLPDEWHLLHALIHHQISDHGYARHVLALKPLWEFAMLGSELPDQGWQAIGAHMAEAGQADVLADWIVQAAELFGLHYPPGVRVSQHTRAHARATIAAAQRADWLRRARFLADQVRFGFSRKTMAVRYQLDEDAVSLATYRRHLQFLLQRYRGRLWGRLSGRGDRPS